MVVEIFVHCSKSLVASLSVVLRERYLGVIIFGRLR
jgi:hypothetical protein